MATIQSYFKSFFELIYPPICVHCNRNYHLDNHFLCISCLSSLPKTFQHLNTENDFTTHFWGRVPIVTGSSLFYYGKSGIVQDLIHLLKYKDRKDIGHKLGQMLGQNLIDSPLYKTLDLILPVPLHANKEKERGYNQCDLLASGIAQVMAIPWSNTCLLRNNYTESQTNKSRFERVQNVNEAFSISQKHDLINKHILLVDDVLTTGATLESCAKALIDIEGISISMATIGMGKLV